MLDAFIIKEIERKEQEQRRERELPLPDYQEIPATPEKNDRGILIIDTEPDSNYGTIVPLPAYKQGNYNSER
ncbi:hypothetical protein HZB00_00455 [Candidatus Woesearchaeota archaeon]|nr:hypothetical protein [Candidatus Woesearchaeota archaeon]